MRTNHAFHRRTVLCLGLGLALLGHVSIARAANGVVTFPFQTFVMHQVQNDTYTAFGLFPRGGVAVPARLPVFTGGSSGWSNAANWSSRATAAGGVEIATAGEIAVGRYAANATLTGTASKAALSAAQKQAFMAVGRLAGPLGMAFTMSSLLDYMAVNDVQKNPDQSDPNKPFLAPEMVQGTQYRTSDTNPWESTKSAACAKAAAGKTYPGQTASVTSSDPQCVLFVKSDGPYPGRSEEFGYMEQAGMIKRYKPASLHELEPYLTRPSTLPLPTFIDETERIRAAHPAAGIEPFKLPLDEGQKVTGPATVGTPQTTTSTSTKTNPDGSTTTTTTTTTKTPTATYSGDKVTVTERERTVTEEVTCTQSGTCTTTKPKLDEETEKPATEETDLCKLHPEILACQELDTPEDEIPRSTKELTYTEDTMFSGGGSCPADSYVTLHTGQTLKVWDWQKSCNMIVTYLRPLLLVVAAYIAFMMLVPQS